LTPVLLPTDAAPAVVVAVERINLRSGPGTGYQVVGQAVVGQRSPILGRNASGDWWLGDLEGSEAWLFAALVTVEGDASAVAVRADVPTASAAVASSPVRVYETSLSLPTYPYAAFTQDAYDPRFDWSYRRFDQQAYEASNPLPVPQTYRLVVLENEYLRVTLLPELGGRVYQVIFKPTGSNEMYQNPVVKPSTWGPAQQGGWLAVGGIEWSLPVEEHGYAWGEPWGVSVLPATGDQAGVTVFMPDQGHLRAEVDVLLRAGEAAFTLRPRLINPGDRPLTFKFWLDAMLAPGPGNTVGPGLRYLFPSQEMTVHSRGDVILPAQGEPMSWPLFAGRDYSLLGNWNKWLGFFERPAAHGPYAGVYDGAADEGIMRVYPPDVARGSKGFGLGWLEPIKAGNYTDDGSAYVELHGGLAPTFDDQITLAAGQVVTWEETWFPVAGIGGVSHADADGAVLLEPAPDGLRLGVYSVRPLDGHILLTVDGQVLLEDTVRLSPDRPFRRVLPLSEGLSGRGVVLALLDAASLPVLHYERLMP
jgi:uncharacterized protein YraI